MDRCANQGVLFDHVDIKVSESSWIFFFCGLNNCLYSNVLSPSCFAGPSFLIVDYSAHRHNTFDQSQFVSLHCTYEPRVEMFTKPQECLEISDNNSCKGLHIQHFKIDTGSYESK